MGSPGRLSDGERNWARIADSLRVKPVARVRYAAANNFARRSIAEVEEILETGPQPTYISSSTGGIFRPLPASPNIGIPEEFPQIEEGRASNLSADHPLPRSLVRYASSPSLGRRHEWGRRLEDSALQLGHRVIEYPARFVSQGDVRILERIAA